MNYRKDTFDIKKQSLERHIIALRGPQPKINCQPNNDINMNFTPDTINLILNNIILAVNKNNCEEYIKNVSIVNQYLDHTNLAELEIITISFAQALLEAVDVFNDQPNCIYSTFYCISKLLLCDDLRLFFLDNHLFDLSLIGVNADDENVSFNGLRILTILLNDVIKANNEIDIPYILDCIDNKRYVSRQHEYLSTCILHRIVENTNFNQYFERIVDILCYIPEECTDEDTLAEVAETILSILNYNFGYFYRIHNQLGITSVLFEQLDECTVSTVGINFPIPILKIILCVIERLEPNESIPIAKMISDKMYESLINESLIEVAELALKIVSFLIENGDSRTLPYFYRPHLINQILTKFIDDAPFIMKVSGLKFIHSLVIQIHTLHDMELLLSFKFIERCSFCYDCDEIDIFLTILVELIHLLTKFNNHEFSNVIYQEIISTSFEERIQELFTNADQSKYNKCKAYIDEISNFINMHEHE